MSDAKANKRKGFFRPTLTIPKELSGFIAQRKNLPQHAGNLSSYIRSLVIDDQKRQQSQTQPDQEVAA